MKHGFVDTEQQNGRFSFKIGKQRREKHGMNTLRFHIECMSEIFRFVLLLLYFRGKGRKKKYMIK